MAADKQGKIHPLHGLEQYVQNQNKAGWFSFFLFLSGTTARGVSFGTEPACIAAL